MLFSLTLSFPALILIIRFTDLTPLFNWNTKQLFLYLEAEYSNAQGVSFLRASHYRCCVLGLDLRGTGDSRGLTGLRSQCRCGDGIMHPNTCPFPLDLCGVRFFHRFRASDFCSVDIHSDIL